MTVEDRFGNALACPSDPTSHHLSQFTCDLYQFIYLTIKVHAQVRMIGGPFMSLPDLSLYLRRFAEDLAVHCTERPFIYDCRYQKRYQPPAESCSMTVYSTNMCTRGSCLASCPYLKPPEVIPTNSKRRRLLPIYPKKPFTKKIPIR